MPRHVNSFGPMMSGVVCVLLAAVAIGVGGPAQAECIVQPNQQAPEGSHWSLHYDRAQNRRCWILVDATGREVSTPPAQADAPALSSFQAFLSKLTGGPPSPPPQEAPGAAVAPSPRRPPPNVVSANRAEHAARTEQKEKSDGHAAKRELTEPEREALFEEFLRWHESQQIIGTVNPSPR